MAWRPQVCLQDTLEVAKPRIQELVICMHSMDTSCGENARVHEGLSVAVSRSVLPGFGTCNMAGSAWIGAPQRTLFWGVVVWALISPGLRNR